jgi:vacuolar-type H+-ATPase subunit E/Vma4
MGRFDRSDAPAQSDVTTAGTAADKLKATIDQQVREVVEEATERAATIEDRAKVKADDIERSARHRADSIVRESNERANRAVRVALERAEGMREATDTLQTELAKVIDSFREEIELLTTELRAAGEGGKVQSANPRNS